MFRPSTVYVYIISCAFSTYILIPIQGVTQQKGLSWARQKELALVRQKVLAERLKQTIESLDSVLNSSQASCYRNAMNHLKAHTVDGIRVPWECLRQRYNINKITEVEIIAEEKMIEVWDTYEANAHQQETTFLQRISYLFKWPIRYLTTRVRLRYKTIKTFNAVAALCIRKRFINVMANLRSKMSLLISCKMKTHPVQIVNSLFLKLRQPNSTISY